MNKLVRGEQPGDALIFLGSTLHGGGGNASAVPRRGIVAAEMGKPFAPPRDRERIDGRIVRRVDLQSGRYALLENSREFTLVPWRPVLEARIGKTASGIIRADGVSWQFGRRRSGPEVQ